MCQCTNLVATRAHKNALILCFVGGSGLVRLQERPIWVHQERDGPHPGPRERLHVQRPAADEVQLEAAAEQRQHQVFHHGRRRGGRVDQKRSHVEKMSG